MATRLTRQPSNSVLYLYGVGKKVPEESLSDLIGVDGNSEVEKLDCAGLKCFVSRVSRTEFADELAKNMESLDWLAEVGVRHQTVVSSLAKETDILPARFGTVFLNTSSLEVDIRKRKKRLLTDLRRIRGCDEWGIKVFSEQKPVQIPTARSQSGKDYLKVKAALLRRADNSVPLKNLENFTAALQRIAVDTAQSGKIIGRQRNLKWQSSLLLKREDRKKLEIVLRKFSNQWANSGKIECTGPWPPYSFVSGGRSTSEAAR